jgi:hypothetical protein
MERCGLWNDRIIAPFFSHNTVTGENYLDVANGAFPAILNEQVYHPECFQQDSSSSMLSTDVQSDDEGINVSVGILL